MTDLKINKPVGILTKEIKNPEKNFCEFVEIPFMVSFFCLFFVLFSLNFLNAADNVFISTNTATNVLGSTSTTKNVIISTTTTQNVIVSTAAATEPVNELVPDQKITLTSDLLYRDTAAGKIDAQGNVVAKFQDTVVYAEDLEYHDGTGFTKSVGNVRMRDSKEYLRGENLEYEVNTETGVIKNATSLSYPWIVKGKTIQKVSKDKVIVTKGRVTSCDYEHPDFYFKASKIVIYLKDKMISYNVVLFIKGIPIIYLPIMRQSLKDLPVEIQVAVGQNTVDGWYEKVKIKYPFTRDKSLTAYVDKYDFRGWGLGLQYDYKDADKTNGSIYLYGIDDRIDKVDKRTFKLSHFQKLTPNLRSYTNVNYQSNQYQNTTVNPTDIINSDIHSYSSLNYIRDLYSMLFVWERNDTWNTTKNAYVKATETLPSFSFTTNTNKVSIKKTVEKADLQNLGFNVDELWDDLVEKGYIDQDGQVSKKYLALSNASELNLQQDLVKKEDFKNLGFNVDELWLDLIAKGYIDEKGKIVAKFAGLTNFSDMKLDKKIVPEKAKKEQIFKLLKNINETNKAKKEKVFPVLKPALNNLFYKYNFAVANNYNSTNESSYVTGNSAFSLTNSIKLNKSMTLTPTVGVREIMTNTLNSQNKYDEKYSTRVDNTLALKNRLTRDMDVNFTYLYTTGVFAENVIDTNKLNVDFNSYFLNGRLKLRTYSGYNFNLRTDSDLNRWDDITTEMRIKFSKYFNSYSKHQYSVSGERISLFQNILYFYPTAKLSFSENATFQGSTYDTLDTISTIKYRPNLKWKFDFNYRCDYNYTKSDFSNLKTREFAVYRDLHCWEMKVSILDKLDTESKIYREYWLIFNLKAIPSQEISLYRDNKYYDQWYYWDIKNKT